LPPLQPWLDDRVNARYGAIALRGFAFGAGFAVACAFVLVVARELLDLGLPATGGAPSQPRPVAAAHTLPPPSIATQLRVASQRLERRNGDSVVIGVLHNGSSSIVRSVRVEAMHHDAAGRLVDVCGWYIGTSIDPGEDKAFKVSCGGTPERPSPESATVRLRLVEGY